MYSTTYAVQYLLDAPAEEVLPLTGGPYPGTSNSLVIPPGNYTTGYGSFTFRSGLFSVMRVDVADDGTDVVLPSSGGDYVIVGSSDPLQVCFAVAMLGRFGAYDSANANWFGIAKKRSIALMCGQIVPMLRAVLDEPHAHPTGSHQHRGVQVFSAQPRNGFNDGHVTMEIKRDGQWMLYDPLLHRAWKKNPGGDYMSLKDFSNEAASGTEYVLAPMEADNFPYPGASAYGYHSEIAFRRLMALGKLQSEVVERLYRGAVGIWHTDGLCYFYLPPQAQHLTNYILGRSAFYRILPYEQWANLLY